MVQVRKGAYAEGVLMGEGNCYILVRVKSARRLPSCILQALP